MSDTNKIYMDYAAATPVDPSVVDAMLLYYSAKFQNPSAIYNSARDVKKDIEQARRQVAQIIGARPDEVIFTAGATESCNLAIKGVLDLHSSANVITSSIEHDAVLKPANGYDHKIAKVNNNGIIDNDHIQSLIDDNTVLVSLIYANNEIGVVQNLSQIAAMVSHERAKRKQSQNKLPIYLHSDGAQAGNYLDLHVSRLGVDLLTINGSKIYGPKQSGILYVKGGSKLKPQIEGGSHEFGLRSGTENVAGIIGFAKALEVAQTSRKDESYRQAKLRDDLIVRLEKIEGLIINGSKKHRLPNNVNFSMPGHDGERIVMMLDEQGFEVATGAACSASSDESSHVLKAIGRSDEEAMGSIRVSLGRNSTHDDIDNFAKSIEQLSKNI